MSKLVVESALRDFDQAYGLRSVSLRYFNAAGADPDREIGEDHDPETHAVPLAIQAAIGQRSTFEIYGTDYPTPDGTAIRDYVHVSDLATGHVLAMKYLLEDSSTVELNLGTGRGHSVRELITSVEKVSGRSVPVREGPKRPGDPPVLVADPTKARKVLGWRLTYASIDKIVETAFRWHSRQQ
jgi:UDP-glucose 4-epimerase